MKLNPHTTEREFSGLPGAIGISLGLPALIIFFGLVFNETYCQKGWVLDVAAIRAQLPQNLDGWYALVFDSLVWFAYLGWFSALAVASLILPGKHAEGTQLRDGKRLDYTVNGLAITFSLLALLAARLLTAPGYYLVELDFLYTHHLQLTLVTIVFSFLLAVFVHVCSYIPLSKANGAGTRERILSENGNTGNIVYDWFIGRELNPRLGSWDIKLFCELRPGMLLLFLINLACAHHQYHSMGKVSDAMILVNVLQAFYIFDGVLNEEGCLTMIDITTDGFGFMLSFGDLAWLPFAYSLQARFLAASQTSASAPLGWVNVLMISALMALGYYIFHSSNQQKSDFRQGRLDKKNLKCIKTKTGSRLLADGWWGYSQHINYLGDWLIGWLWCLPTGFESPLTYFYVVYFALLLLHRQTRDEAKCRAKYGSLWTEYENLVPYKIIPYVY